MEIVAILDKYKPLIKFLHNYPVFREKIRTVHEFDVELVSECLESAKKVQAKLYDIYYFEGYEAEKENNLSTEQLRELIDALKAQFGFLQESK